MSVRFIRRLRKDQIALVDKFANELKPSFTGEKYKNVLSWCNVYFNKQFNFDNPSRRALHDWIAGFVQEAYPQKAMNILKYDLIMNPAGSKSNQIWHSDYGTSVDTILIPLVPQGTETATQIIETQLKTKGYVSPLGYESHYSYDIMEILQKQNMDFLKVTQIVCKSHCAMVIPANVVHRGIANSSNHDRLLLTVNLSPVEFKLFDEPIISSNMVQAL